MAFSDRAETDRRLRARRRELVDELQRQLDRADHRRFRRKWSARNRRRWTELVEQVERLTCLIEHRGSDPTSPCCPGPSREYPKSASGMDPDSCGYCNPRDARG